MNTSFNDHVGRLVFWKPDPKDWHIWIGTVESVSPMRQIIKVKRGRNTHALKFTQVEKVF